MVDTLSSHLQQLLPRVEHAESEAQLFAAELQAAREQCRWPSTYYVVIIMHIPCGRGVYFQMSTPSHFQCQLAFMWSQAMQT